MRSETMELVGTVIFTTLAIFLVGTFVNYAIDLHILSDMAAHPVRSQQVAQLAQERLW